MAALLVINRRARRGGQLGGAVREALTRHGVAFVERERAGERIDAILVAGGDGTFARCIPRALASNVPMGLVPLGTFNDLARTLDIPADIDAACAVIARAHERRIDVARVNGFAYVTEASLGISTRVARLLRRDEKRRFGLGAVIPAVIAALRHIRPFRAEIEYAGGRDTVRAIQITVANSRRFGGFIEAQEVAIDDGVLNCFAVEATGFGLLVTLAAALIGRRPPVSNGLRTYCANAFRITPRRPQRVTADGEAAATSPATFDLIAGALRIFSPGA